MKRRGNMNLKYILWRLGLWGNSCPYCGKQLIEHGFENNRYYTCPDEKCRFNK